MGKTFRNYKGESHREKSRKNNGDRKWMGYTSGNHSDRHSVAGSARIEDGHIVRDFEVRPAIKGKDYIKYGYPDGAYPKHMVQAMKRGYAE